MAIALFIQAFAAIVLAVIGAALWKLLPLVIQSLTSSLLSIPGPPSPGWFRGNIKQILESENESIREQWLDTYGPVITYRGYLSTPRLFTTDTRAINHILTHSFVYQKPAQARRGLSRLLGEGVLITEGEQHRQQRRIMNPAFGPAQIRELTEIFVDKSIELRDVWAAQLSPTGEGTVIDVTNALSKMTLDVIGLAGFNYEFNSLNPKGEPNELAQAFDHIFTVPDRITPMMILQNFFPVLNLIKTERTRQVDAALKTMQRIGRQLITEKKAAILQESSEKGAGVGRKDLQGRDLLTLLLKANMATDIPDSQRLSDDDVLAQVPTFLVAGHETTSTGTAWCLFALAQAPDVQRKLRAELLTLATDAPTMDELNALPYLDMVVRESMRLHAPVATTIRIAAEDDVLPLNAPFRDRSGVLRDHVEVKADNAIIVPIATMNRAKSLWGADADEFRPERWESPPEAAASIPGVWSNVLTFLGGPRACIGYRFSLVEMKALVYTLVRAFEFGLAVPAHEVRRAPGVVQRPSLRSDPARRSQLPLLVRRYQPEAA